MSDESHTETVEGYADKTDASPKIPCPECGGDRTRRVERKGFLEMKVYPIFGYYPWICPDCKSTFLLRRRHRRKSKRRED